MPTFIKTGFWEKTCRNCKGYNGWLNLDELIQSEAVPGPAGTSGTSGSSGTSGTSGTSGFNGDLYRTTSSTSLTIQLGNTPTFVIGTGLGYSVAQDVIIAFNVTNHMIGMVQSYNPLNGQMVVNVQTIEGSGTYSSWSVNLAGAAGGNGSSGTSGTSGLAGTSGTTGSSGTSGTSGATPTVPTSLNYGLFSQTGNSSVITNTTVETTLINGGVGTLTVPANGFSVGDSFRGVFGGVINAGNNQTIRIRVKTGSVILLDSGLQNLGSSVTNDVWSLNIDFTIRQTGTAGVASIVALGSFHYTKTNNASVQGFGFNVVNNTTFNTTVSNTLDVTAQWGAASTGNNIYSDIFILNKIY